VDGSSFKTPGQILREVREARGIDQQEMATRTSIPLRLLAALEIDDYEQLSGDLYVRSFLRSCAKELGLDPQALIDLYQEGINAQQATEAAGEPTWEAEVAVERVGGIPWAMVLRGAAAVLAVVLIILVVVRISNRGDMDSGQTPDVIEIPAAAAPDTAFDAGAVAEESEVVPEDEPTGAPAATAVAGEGADSAAGGESVPAESGGEPEAGAESETPGDRIPAEDVSTAMAGSSAAAIADMPAGDPTLIFADGRRRSLVLRIVGPSPLAVAVAADGAELVPLSVPGRGAISSLPDHGIESGRLYRARDRYVAYWAGDDYFFVRLAEDAGVSVSLNGRPIDIPPGVVGREWELNADKAAP